jgi:hypothetical protein
LIRAAWTLLFERMATATDTTVEQLRKTALKLPQAARAYLAEELIESLDSEDGVELPPGVIAEAGRRARAIDEGRARTVSLTAAVKQLRRPRKR